MDDLGLSRDQILSGQFSKERQALKLLKRIEERCQYFLSESRRVIEAYFLNDQQDFSRQFDLDNFLGFRLKLQSRRPLQLHDLERYVPLWSKLLPESSDEKAHLIQAIAQRYPLLIQPAPALRLALGFEQESVQAAYQSNFGRTLEPSETQTQPTPESLLTPDEAVVEEAVAGLEWLLLQDGQALYHSGDSADALYGLINGRLQVFTQDESGSEKLVGQVGRGEMVGALEIFTDEQRATTVRAIRDSELVRLGRLELFRLAEKHPAVMLRLNRLIAGRLKAHLTGEPASINRLTTFAILPAGGAARIRGKSIHEFSKQLADLLSLYGSTLHLDRRKLEDELGQDAAQAEADGPENNRLTAWLSEREARYRFLVYEADLTPTAWTRRAIRQADLVLLVGDATASPRLGPIEEELARMERTAGVELVLLHPAGSHRPSGTTQWLERRSVRAHHHVRLDVAEDLRRLTRRLTGRSLGLVLGGGGARGFAHVGAHQALLEAGFDIDLLGGTSMGSILGAAYALDMTYPQLLALARKVSSPLKLFDPTLPLVSFFSSEKVTRVFQEIFEDIQIEDLWRPFFCVSSNLTRAVPMVHQSGPLWMAVRASSAIPGVFSPLLYEGELLVDGAVLNNLPVDVMQNFSQGGPIAAVNVFPEVDLNKKYDFGPSVSGWATLLNKVNPLTRGSQAPSIFENILRVIALNDVHQAKFKRERVDLYINPPVERYGILEFSAYKRIIALGYEAAQQEIAAWKKDPGSSRLGESLPPRPVDRLNRALDQLDQALEEMQVSPIEKSAA